MQLWTFEHFVTLIPTVIIMILITLLLSKLLKNKSYEVRMIPFKIIAGLLLLSEILKQVISIIKGYDLYHIPLHVCSLFIFLVPLMAFYRGKGEKVIRSLTCTVSLSLCIFMTVYPNLIYGPECIRNFLKNYFDFHTVFFHNLVIFEFILIIGLNLHSIKGLKHDKYVLIASSIYASIAGIVSQILKTNFSNFYTCNIGPVNDFVNIVKNSLGYGAGQTIYVIILLLLHVAFFYGSYKLYCLLDFLLVKIRSKKQKN